MTQTETPRTGRPAGRGTLGTTGDRTTRYFYHTRTTDTTRDTAPREIYPVPDANDAARTGRAAGDACATRRGHLSGACDAA